MTENIPMLDQLYRNPKVVFATEVQMEQEQTTGRVKDIIPISRGEYALLLA